MKYFYLSIISITLLSCTSKTAEDKSEEKGPEKDAVLEESISTKRLAPKEVKPVIHEGIEYHSAMNEVFAINMETKDTSWSKVVYEVVYNNDLERDVQDVFIDSMLLANNSLLIRNENGEFYLLNLADQSTFPNKANNIELNKMRYSIIIQDLTKNEFDLTEWGDTSNILFNQNKCLAEGRIRSESPIEYQLLLNSGQYFTLKKEQNDEQFFGYSLIHFDSTRNIYVFWENWLEAGHPIMINAKNGELTEIYGEYFSDNNNKTLTANFAEDIGAGWTPNGIMIFDKNNEEYKKLFEFNPSIDLNDNWGPVELKWKNDSTLLIHAITHDGNSGYTDIYKKLQFAKK